MARTDTIVEVLGGPRVFRRGISKPWDLQQRVREGLPYASLESVIRKLRLARAETAAVLLLTPRTLARRKAERWLHADESDRLFRVARILAQAREVLGTEENAAGWLRRRNRALRSQPPLSLLDTEIGARAVEDILLRLEHGVVS